VLIGLKLYLIALVGIQQVSLVDELMGSHELVG